MSPTTPRCAAAALAVVACAAAACSDGSQPASYEAPRGAQRVLTGLGIEITSEGRRVLRIEADSGFAREESPEVALVGVEARAFDEQGIPGMTLEADSGRLDEDTRMFTALGDVRARRQDGTVSVQAPVLVFDPATGRLTSDTTVVVERAGGSETLPCFQADPLLREWGACGGSP